MPELSGLYAKSKYKIVIGQIMELALYIAKFLATDSYNFEMASLNQLQVFINKTTVTLLMIWFIRLFE